MKTYIALLRGINVGGGNALPMKDLAALLESLGSREVTTYINSGNAVFRSSEGNPADLADKLTAAIREHFDFEPFFLVLEKDALEQAILQNPFPEVVSNPASLHLGFLASIPVNPDMEKLAGLKKDTERFRLIDRVFYLHAPEGVGRSKLAAGAERLLGVLMTDRNWKTVTKIRDIVKGYSG